MSKKSYEKLRGPVAGLLLLSFIASASNTSVPDGVTRYQASAFADRIVLLPAGNAASSQTLAQANIASARCLIVAIANSLEAGQIISHARAANPSLQILARAQADSEVDYLKTCSADLVVMGEREIARIMLARLGLPAD